MPDNELSFEDRRGERQRARLEVPVERAPVAYALFAHAPLPEAAGREIVRALARAGVATLRLELTGDGGDRDVDDVLDAAAALTQGYGAPHLLVGFGAAGSAALRAAARLPDVRAVATLATPYDAALLDDPLRALRRPLLVLHSPVDNVVGVDHARRIFEAALHPKSFVSLHQADHHLEREDDARFAGAMIAGWAAPHLARDEAPAWQADVADDRTVVRTEGGLRTEVLTHGFELLLDEPIKAGGTNTGPNPYDLLAAALGACTSMTLRLYADRKGWPLQAAMVEVDHRKVTVDDDGGGDGKPKRVDLFERRIAVEGPLDETQRARLLEIANRCPVHRTLTGEVRVESRLVEALEGVGA